MKEQSSLFKNNHYCKECRRPLPTEYHELLCPNCQEQELFQQVKAYIRSQDVNEYDVAAHFHLPLLKVKQWIRQGRIQYKGKDGLILTKSYCQQCGTSIEFGTYCSKCQKKANLTGQVPVNLLDLEQKFRYIPKK